MDLTQRPLLVIATTIAALSIPTADAVLIDAVATAIKIVGSACGFMLIWYAKRVVRKLEVALDFFEKAPEDAWVKFGELQGDVRALKGSVAELQRLAGVPR